MTDHRDDHTPADPTPDDADTGDSTTAASEAGGADAGSDSVESDAPQPRRGPAGADSGAPRRGSGSAGGFRANREAYENGVAQRALARDIEDLRLELRRGLSGTREALRRELREFAQASAGYFAELLPRVDHLEQLLARVGPNGLGAGSGDGAGVPPHSPAAGAAPGSDADPDADAEPGADDPPVTPAAGWDAMDRASAEQAWTALGEFVDTVLFRRYRLSRLQVPDCWPVHPRMVRELAWLRSSYLEAQELEAQDAAGSLPWHIRAIPGFLINTADAVDTRECRPGVHRLTDPEVSSYAVRRRTAEHEGRPEPVLTTETGPDRPQLHPAHYPTRSTSTAASPHDSAEPKAPTVTTLPELLVGACHPEHWISYYREASAADLQRRSD